ncbi:RcnB family protein [Variovorax sp. J22G21]|uniref:RcnB family protein n=1 Tax=Variovorax fucosicus TaxID=3053517 RepID=UPI002576EDF4|nr:MULTISPECIES: RcnB family protein [unclassified Variovorax]MDM0039229.1 RcnB family protein [Variovorax sp. J22R193]MDM0064005.1 RcnB family protein [Variovorax sp. J22G21]
MNIKSRTVAIVAATLALSGVGSAFAQDRFQPRSPDRDGRFEQRGDRQDFRNDRNGRHDRDGRFDHRGDRQDFRNDRNGRHDRDGRFDHRGDRQDFRDGRHVDRSGFPSPHAEWRRGGRVPTEYRGRNYVVNDWRGHHLNAPPRGYQWVGVGGDYVLAALATGLIAQIIVGQ